MLAPTDRPRLNPERLGAVSAGVSALLMAVLAIVANVGVLVPLQGAGDVPGEAAVRAAAAALLVVAVLDVVVAWGLWLVLRHSAPELVLLATWSRVAYAAVLAVAVPTLLRPFATSEVGAEASRSAARSFADSWQAGLVIFALHLLLVGVVVVRTGVLPRWIGALLLIAGAAYASDGLSHILLGPGGPHETILMVVLTVSSGVGELALAVWLLARGGRGPVPGGRVAPNVARSDGVTAAT